MAFARRVPGWSKGICDDRDDHFPMLGMKEIYIP